MNSKNSICLMMPIANSTILSQTYEHMNYADVIFTCKDSYSSSSDADTGDTVTTSIKQPVAHKSVLATCSSFLRSLLESNQSSHELIVPDVTTETIVRILELVYTGKVCVGSQKAISELVEGIELLGINYLVSEIQISQIQTDVVAGSDIDIGNGPDAENVENPVFVEPEPENIFPHFPGLEEDSWIEAEVFSPNFDQNSALFIKEAVPTTKKKRRVKRPSRDLYVDIVPIVPKPSKSEPSKIQKTELMPNFNGNSVDSNENLMLNYFYGLGQDNSNNYVTYPNQNFQNGSVYDLNQFGVDSHSKFVLEDVDTEDVNDDIEVSKEEQLDLYKRAAFKDHAYSKNKSSH